MQPRDVVLLEVHIMVVHPVNTGNTVLAAQQQQGHIQPDLYNHSNNTIHKGAQCFKLTKSQGQVFHQHKWHQRTEVKNYKSN